MEHTDFETAFSPCVAAFDRWEIALPADSGATAVEIVPPQSQAEIRPTFLHQPGVFTYDYHGYETLAPSGSPVLCARYTPVVPGQHRFTVRQGNKALFSASFEVATGAPDRDFVKVSGKDSRYFALQNGACFCPVGINLVGPDGFQKSAGREFALAQGKDYMGLRQYESWFRQFSENGGNLVRLWLDNPYFSVDTGVADQFDLLQFAKLDGVFALARKYGIRLKLTFEHFRVFDLAKTENAIFKKDLALGAKTCGSGSEWIEEGGVWQEDWQKKIDAYLARYGNDPTVFCFELWNEMNCFDASFEKITDFTARWLRYIRQRAPKNMAVNSLGSYDDPAFTKWLDAFKMEEMSFQQLHRYLDQGAKTEICRADPIAFVGDGIRAARRLDRPILLAETGAVNDCHTGLFRFCSADHLGLILTDEVYSPFFFESAGCGHIWHWNCYVEPNNLWRYYRPFAKLVEGEALDTQNLRARDASNEKAFLLLLEGDGVVYGYARNRSDSWYRTLRDQLPPEPVASLKVELPFAGELQLFPVWDAETASATLAGNTLQVEGLLHGFLFKVRR